MTLRTIFLITALVLCHQLLVPKLVTSQLLARSAGKPVPVSDEQAGSKVSGPCAEQAAKVQDERIPTICAIQQEKIGDIYKLQRILGHADLKATSIYLSISQEDAATVADKAMQSIFA